MEESAAIDRIDAFVYRCPTDRPVSTSFGIMRDRPAVFVRIETRDGCFGWGEIFANWPAAGAEHRANLLVHDIADLVIGMVLRSPDDIFEKLERETRIRAIQCGEPGPFRQVTAGLDIAAWDLAARRKGLPLSKLLDTEARERIPAYASGIHVRDGADTVARMRNAGFSAFKVKVGFDLEQDAAEVAAIADTLCEGERLFTDANQSWDLAQAKCFVGRLAGLSIGWLEEPMPVDAPADDWLKLAEASQIPLAGGENIAGDAEFKRVIEAGALSILQPDVAKWGGITGCRSVALEAIAAGCSYCPHFLGGGIGLLASAHLLAAVGGDGRLEVDVNANPLRDGIADTKTHMRNGFWQLDQAVGLGVDDLPRDFTKFQTQAVTQRARTVVGVV